MKTFILCLFALSQAFAARVPYISNTYIQPKKAYELSLGGEYFTTSGTFNDSGNDLSFTDQQDYQRINWILALDYSPNNKWSIGGGVRYRSNSSTDVNGNNLTASGLESMYVNSRYLFYKKEGLEMALGGEVRNLLSSNVPIANASTEIQLGNEGTQLSIYGSLTQRMKKRFSLSLLGGFRKRGTDLSDELIYNINLFYIHRKFAFGGGLSGFESFGNDLYDGDTTNRPFVSAGQTASINSFNPVSTTIYGAANYSFSDRLLFEGRMGQTIRGENYDNYGFLAGSLRYLFGGQDAAVLFENKFKEYDFEAAVVKVSPRGKFVKIDKGLSHDLEKGGQVDFYLFNYTGGNKLMASGKIYEVSVDSSIVRILKFFNGAKKVAKEHVARGRRY